MRQRALALAVVLATAAGAHAFTLEGTRVEAMLLDASSKDPFRLRAQIAGVDPAAVASGPGTLRFGSLQADIPAGGFRRRGKSLVWKSYTFGVKKVVVNVKKATLDIVGGNLELGSFPGPVTLVLATPGAVMCGRIAWTEEHAVSGGNPRKRGTRKIATGPIEPCGAQAPGDRIPPNVRIASPTASAGITTASAVISLGGVAFDDGAVTALGWSNDRGGAGVLAPAAAWAIDDVLLQPGDNRITVTATDASGNVGTDVLDVTYNLNGIVFDGVPFAEPDGMLVGQFDTGLVRQGIVPNPDLDPTSVRLERILDDGTSQVVWAMRDDGNLDEVGDEIQGDSVYTGKLPIHSDTPGVVRFRVSARSLSQPELVAWGPVLAFPYVERVAQEELEAAVRLANDARTIVASIQAQGRPMSEAIGGAIGLALARGVLATGPSDGGRGAWWVDANGLLGGVLGHDQATVRGGASGASPAPAPPPSPRAAAVADPAVVQVGSRQAIVLAPFFANEEPTAVDAMLRGSTCPIYQVQTYLGADAGAERFRDLDRFGIVVIASHGDSLFAGVAPAYRPEWAWSSVGSQIVVLTGTRLGPHNRGDWEKDLRLGRMAVMPDGVAAILPSFVSRYSIRFPQSVVYVGSCGSGSNATLASAFFERGVATYFGYDGYVASSFAAATGTQLFANLLGGTVTGAAFAPGATDGGTPPAALAMDGEPGMSLTEGVVVNGGFENQSRFAASVPGFTVLGDGRVVGGLGSWLPTTGRRMALISTGLGFTTLAGSFEQPVCIPALPPGATAWTMRFDWKFFSEEFLEYCGSQFQDSLEVKYGDAVLFDVKIDDICGVVSPTPDVVFDKGDVHATAWTTQAIDMTPFAGTTGLLKFAAKDVGDSIYDSAILLDALQVEAE